MRDTTSRSEEPREPATMLEKAGWDKRSTAFSSIVASSGASVEEAEEEFKQGKLRRVATREQICAVDKMVRSMNGMGCKKYEPIEDHPRLVTRRPHLAIDLDREIKMQCNITGANFREVFF